MQEMTVEDMLENAMIGQVLRADRIDPCWFAEFLRHYGVREDWAPPFSRQRAEKPFPIRLLL